MMDFSKLAAQFDIDFQELEAAKNGDFRKLAAKLRKGGSLSKEERNFIADRLEGRANVKRGTKERLHMLDGFVLQAFVHKVEFTNANKTLAEEEIGELIGETPANVRKRIARARKYQGGDTHAMFVRLGHLMHNVQGKETYRPFLESASREVIEKIKGIKLSNELKAVIRP